nr:PREDICTED: C-Jun-amino-terminal kinase-interacting protein 4-like [Latimeria chalumnae]|eukprot:XP_014353028.1 PREDICTED: C-Jun-amino-terminal kinase-interacting protein 4-like [Latimeria chalumnae]
MALTVYVRGYVVAALANGTLAVFSRDTSGQWDATNFRLLDLGRPSQSIRCMVAVGNRVWCGYRNRVYVVDPRAAKVERWFEVTHHSESQVRHMAACEDGVWVSVRLDSTLRLFHAQTGQPLQEVDIEPFVSRMLGSGKLGLAFVQVSALAAFCHRLWIGTGSGAIVTIPFCHEIAASPVSHTSPGGSPASSSIPYCPMTYAQVCFHGHRDAVKFFACVPGCVNPSLAGEGSEERRTQLVMSGGEGYINFRIGDDADGMDERFGDLLQVNPGLRRAERSHLIVWQMGALRP